MAEHTKKQRKAVELNGMKFVRHPDAEYAFDYEEILRKVQEGTYPELDTYRELFLNDLWFVVYFILKVPPANHPWVVATCKEVQQGPVSHTLDLWAREHFKDLSLDTPVPTLSGIRKHGDLVVGDFVFGATGHPVKVVGVSEVFTENVCYELFFDNSERVVAGENHLWQVWVDWSHLPAWDQFRAKVGRGGELVVITTQQMVRHLSLGLTLHVRCGIFKTARISSILPHPTVKTSCIKVDAEDGLYLITESHIVTHNTTILTTAEPIQYRIKRALIDGIEETTGIFAYNRPVAKAFLRGIKNVFEHSEFLKDMFPSICWRSPEKEAPKWSEDDGLVLKRTSFQKESCFEAYGLIEGMPTSKHFSRRLYDDISTLDLVQTPEMMEKVKSRFAMSSNLGTMDGTHRVCGTIYDFNDVLVDLMSKKTQDGKLIYHLRKKPATDDGTFTGNPVLLPVQRNEELKADPKSYATQQLIDPTLTGEEKLFPPELLLEVEPFSVDRQLFKFMTVDTAGDKKTSNGRDAWAILLCGIKPNMDELGQSELTILDAVIERLEFDKALQIIVDMYCRGGIVYRVGVESMGASMFDTHVANALRARGRIVTLESGNLVKLQASGRKKAFRIESALSWPLRNGKIKISKAVPEKTIDRLKMEMDKFPYWHDDGLDALAYQYELFKDFRFGKYQMEESSEDAYERKYQEMMKAKSGDGWMYV